MSVAATFAARAGVELGEALASALEQRAGVLERTASAEAAVLTPREPGAWSHALRAALAARIARHHELGDIAEPLVAAAGAGCAALADPAEDGAAQGLAAAVAFTDRVSSAPREVTAADIAGLQAAGIADADIVRLAELNAFLAYHYRLIAGLRLLATAGGSQ